MGWVWGCRGGRGKTIRIRGAAVTELDRDQAPQEADDGADPSVVMAAQFARAADYDRAGDLAAAIGLYESVLTGREALWGADHPDTRAARRDLADAYERSGAVDRAIPLYETVLAGSRRRHGVDDAVTAVDGNDLALAYEEVGRDAEAIALFDVACQRDGTTVLPRAWDHLGVWLIMAVIGRSGQP